MSNPITELDKELFLGYDLLSRAIFLVRNLGENRNISVSRENLLKQYDKNKYNKILFSGNVGLNYKSFAVRKIKGEIDSFVLKYTEKLEEIIPLTEISSIA